MTRGNLDFKRVIAKSRGWNLLWLVEIDFKAQAYGSLFDQFPCESIVLGIAYLLKPSFLFSKLVLSLDKGRIMLRNEEKFHGLWEINFVIVEIHYLIKLDLKNSMKRHVWNWHYGRWIFLLTTLFNHRNGKIIINLTLRIGLLDFISHDDDCEVKSLLISPVW